MELYDEGDDDAAETQQKQRREAAVEFAIVETTVTMLGRIVQHVKAANVIAEREGRPLEFTVGLESQHIKTRTLIQKVLTGQTAKATEALILTGLKKKLQMSDCPDEVWEFSKDWREDGPKGAETVSPERWYKILWGRSILAASTRLSINNKARRSSYNQTCTLRKKVTSARHGKWLESQRQSKKEATELRAEAARLSACVSSTTNQQQQHEPLQQQRRVIWTGPAAEHPGSAKSKGAKRIRRD